MPKMNIVKHSRNYYIN